MGFASSILDQLRPIELSVLWPISLPFHSCLQMFDDIIFAFFSLEMTIKMVAMGIYGKGTYLADSWNRLDFFIVAAGWVFLKYFFLWNCHGREIRFHWGRLRPLHCKNFVLYFLIIFSRDVSPCLVILLVPTQSVLTNR